VFMPPDHRVTLRVPPLLAKEGRKGPLPLLPEEGCLRNRRGGGSPICHA
jgi:hypothetical protein